MHLSSSRPRPSHRSLQDSLALLGAGALCWCIFACLPTLAEAQVFDWQLNVEVVEHQTSGALAEAPNGDLIFVWESANFDLGDLAVVMRRFQADGTALDASERRVNDYQIADQEDPDLALDASGELVVVWQGRSISDTLGVVARRFAADGTPLTTDLQVNTSTTGNQIRPRVARAPGGEFAVVWYDALLGEVHARRFAADGSPIAAPFVLGAPGSPFGSGYDIAYAPSGDLLIAWGESDQIFVQRFDAAGAPVGTAITVSEPNDGNGDPSLAVAADGRYLVVWHGLDLPADRPVLSQLMSASDLPLGPNQNLKSNLTQISFGAVAAVETDGRFRVAWTEESTVPANDFDVVSRHLDTSGLPLGTVPTVATGFPPGNQMDAALTALASGGSRLMWTGVDQSVVGVFTDMPTNEPLFADGFESGNTLRWFVTTQ